MIAAAVRVRYFAAARERAGLAEETVELPAGARVADAAAEIARRHPALEGLLRASRLAVNLEFADAARAIAAGDELAVIPPVSGG